MRRSCHKPLRLFDFWQSNQGRREETYRIYERLQYIGCIQDSQQTSQPQIKPDPQDLQARPSVPDIPLYSQIQTSQGVYLDYISPKYSYRHQGSRGITHDPIGPPGAHSNWEGNSYARRISPAQFLSGTSVGSTPVRRHSSHGDRSKKSQRISIAYYSCRELKVRCNSERPYKNYERKHIEISSRSQDLSDPAPSIVGQTWHLESRRSKIIEKKGSDIANAIPELKAFEPVGHKRKRSASAASQLSIEQALFLLILTLAGKFDATSPSAQSVQKPCLGACLEENTFSEPGLKYFAAATDIIARHTSGTSLCHMQAFLLKGIYHGQWARDSKCATSLLEAANALQIFLLQYLLKLSAGCPTNGVIHSLNSVNILTLLTQRYTSKDFERGLYKEYQPDEVYLKSPWAIRLKAKFVAAIAFAARHFLMVILNQED
ncbi:uncharacterized protein RSE6_15015 [Rhynchosporium secalis]|uniref:Transcription factor domain-containing protein n=1 Tax=Rhynchosporium secalis TaxID=38038 RepID=A0A1E1MWJ4_RHYSE|nr:uncharacterized protein RSE6_15015 [Rhynchosporium secalis]